MVVKKRHRFWNVIIVITVLLSISAFTAHFKNWTKIESGQIKILSGFYYKKLNFTQLDSVLLIEKIPPMERLNGFSAFQKEKGLFREFKDSLTDSKVHVYVDNLANQKIKLVYGDSLKLYINYTDSLKTTALYEMLKAKIQPPE